MFTSCFSWFQRVLVDGGFPVIFSSIPYSQIFVDFIGVNDYIEAFIPWQIEN